MVNSISAAARPIKTRVLGGITVVDTLLVTEALDYARSNSEPYLFNHVMRSWLFAVRLGQLQEVKYDEEVLAVGTLLHDLGLTDCCIGNRRFEVEGADAARDFARQHGLDDRRSQLIWDSVALNATPSIALFKEAEVALCSAGTGVEFGFQYDRISPEEMNSVLAEYPRLEMKRRFADSICSIVEKRPETTYDNWAGDFGERLVPDYKRPSTVDYLMNAPFQE